MQGHRTKPISTNRTISIIGGIVLGLVGLRSAQAANGIRLPGMDLSRRRVSGVLVGESVTINQPAHSVYRLWRDMENLPMVLSHLKDVQVSNSRQSHWIAKAPMGATVEWDAEIVSDERNRRIAWRSLEGQNVQTLGLIRLFERDGSRTTVRLSLKYEAPVGESGAVIRSFLGNNPSRQIREDLLRLKRSMETGESVGLWLPDLRDALRRNSWKTMPINAHRFGRKIVRYPNRAI
jgi:uncharacterized membrane protein